MKTLLPFFIVLFCSCYGQNTTTLTFVNKAKFDIDSIVVFKPDRINFEKLSIGQQYSKKVQDVLINSSREGAFTFTVYINGQAFSGTWGFHDFGMLGSTSETFYIFDHGINTTDKPLEKPKDFKIYFYNASTKPIDSIINIDSSIKKVNELSPRSLEIVYDFDKIQKLNDFSVIINGQRKSSRIDYDFDNWNYSQTFFHYENDSIKKGSLPWREPLEFQFDLYVKLPIPSDSFKVESSAIVKTYSFKQPNYLKVVFDFKKLRQNPIFKVKTPNKEYIVDVSTHDFSNIYSHQVIYYLDEKGIKSQMY